MTDLYSIRYYDHNNTEKTKSFSVAWTIPELLKENASISDLRTNRADCAADADEDTKFLLKLLVVGKETKLIQIYYLAPVTMCLKYRFSHDTKQVEKEYFMVQRNKWQFMTELNKENIEGSNNQRLQIYVNFTINKEIKVDPSCYGPKAELNSDLENLLNNSIYSDAIIKSAEGVEFQIHKGVLVIRCAVLKAHFEQNIVVNFINIIETSLETEVLKEVLRYIYTDNTPKVDEIPEKLLAAADYYQLSRLKHLCEEALFQKLTIDNAIATLQLADLHSATNLKKMTLGFINDGHARLVIETKRWMELQSAALTKTILEYIFRNGEMNANTS